MVPTYLLSGNLSRSVPPPRSVDTNISPMDTKVGTNTKVTLNGKIFGKLPKKVADREKVGKVEEKVEMDDARRNENNLD